MARKILLAKDNPQFRFVMQEFPEKLEHKCALAKNALRGIVEARPSGYSAILMDIHMPQMTGLEAISLIREMGRPDSDTLPVSAVTVGENFQSSSSIMPFVFNCVLPEPARIGLLDELLDRLFA